MAEFKITLQGNKEIQDALSKGTKKFREPVRRFLDRSVKQVEAKAKEKAPVDRGRLRSSIRSFTRQVPQPRGIVRAGVPYAPYVEFGTRPHWPPLSAMQPWARRHGFPAGRVGAFLVARAIARHGTKPQPYMEPALKESEDDINKFLDMASEEIEQLWERI